MAFEACKFFSMGNCSYGQSCRYPHIGADGKLENRSSVSEITQLTVDNVPSHFKEADLYNLFAAYGSVHEIRLPENGSGKALVQMIGNDKAQKAMNELNVWTHPSQLRVSIASGSEGGPVREHKTSLAGAQKYKTVPCANFPKGLCSFGDNCAFIHGSDISGSRPPPFKFKTLPCANFAKGSCTFGDRCSYIHGSEYAPPGFTTPSFSPYPPSPSFPMSGYNSPYVGHEIYNYPPYVSPLPTYTAPIVTEASSNAGKGIQVEKFKTAPCKKFPLGLCTFGDKCAFIH